MKDESKLSVGILNDLVHYCKDAQVAFEEAARDVHDDSIQKLFATYARRMNEFASENAQRVVGLGAKPRKDAGASGEVRRAWMHFRSVLNLHHTKPVLLECEKEEESLLDHYQKAVESNLPPEIKESIEKQLVEVTEMRTRLRELEETVKN